MKILKAEEFDFLEIRNLDKLIFKENVVDGKHIWKNWIEFCKVIKAVQDNKIVGVGLLIPTFKKYLFLHKIFIHPDFQGRGIGVKIMQRLLKDEDNDIYLTVKPSNKRAINLYKKSGFDILKRVKDFYGKGEERYFMVNKK